MNTSKTTARGLWAALIVILALAGTGCPKNNKWWEKPKGPEKPGKVETDPARFIAAVKARAAAVTRMDAKMEIDLEGVEGPFKGKFLGAIELQRLNDTVSMSIQAYTLIGLPALEMVSIGDRLQVYSPLQNIMYMNFEDLMNGNSAEELPLQDLMDVSGPLDLIRDEVKLVLGLGFSDRYRYQLQSDGTQYTLIEFDGPEIRRQMTYSLSGPDLIGVRVYNEDGLYGSLICSDRFSSPPEARFVPSKMEIAREEMRVGLALSHLRVNGNAAADKISFRKPKDEQLYLLTPAVP
jgi:hypothetical protein